VTVQNPTENKPKKFLMRNFPNKENPINTTKVDRIAETIKNNIAPSTAKDAIALLDWASDKEYDAMKAYYLVGLALYNKDVKSADLEHVASKGTLSKMRKIANAIENSPKMAKAWTDGAIQTFTDAYEWACACLGTVETSRVAYLEDLQAKHAELLAKIAEVEEAMKTAPRKPAKVAKKSK